MITQAYLKQLLDYYPESGVFRWRVDRTNGKIKAGTVAGYIDRGRVIIMIDGRRYVASRLAWLWMTGNFPQSLIIHNDGDRLNARWENLAERCNGMELSQRAIKKMLDYDRKTGEFRWVSGPRRGQLAGFMDAERGRVMIMIDGRSYFASRLAWLWMRGSFPKACMVHEDGDRGNIRWENLAVPFDDDVVDGTVLSQRTLKKILTYDPGTGEFRWTSGPNRGQLAGSPWEGYVRIYLPGKAFKAHRLAFFWVTGRWPIEIDHEDGRKWNNAWCNLREVTRVENGRNAQRFRNNTSGVGGVHWNKKSEKWYAGIRVDGRQLHLGSYSEFEDAVAARKAAEREHGFHPNHGREPVEQWG